MTNGIALILSSCHVINSPRNADTVLNHLFGEVIELSHEVRGTGDGVDGVIGESVDVILCAIDLIYQKIPDVTEEQINKVIRQKLDKWNRVYGIGEKK